MKAWTVATSCIRDLHCRLPGTSWCSPHEGVQGRSLPPLTSTDFKLEKEISRILVSVLSTFMVYRRTITLPLGSYKTTPGNVQNSQDSFVLCVCFGPEMLKDMPLRPQPVLQTWGSACDELSCGWWACGCTALPGAACPSSAGTSTSLKASWRGGSLLCYLFVFTFSAFSTSSKPASF